MSKDYEDEFQKKSLESKNLVKPVPKETQNTTPSQKASLNYYQSLFHTITLTSVATSSVSTSPV